MPYVSTSKKSELKERDFLFLNSDKALGEEIFEQN